MVEKWYWIALLAVLLFALGSFFGKIASINDSVPYRVYFFEAIGTLCVFSAVIFFKRSEIFTDFTFNPHGLLMGLCWGIGTVMFIIVLQHAKLSVTVTLTALYPALTVILAYLFLGERLGPREITAVILAVTSGVLLAK